MYICLGRISTQRELAHTSVVLVYVYVCILFLIFYDWSPLIPSLFSPVIENLTLFAPKAIKEKDEIEEIQATMQRHPFPYSMKQL